MGWEGGERRGEGRRRVGRAPVPPGSFDAHLALLRHSAILAFNC